MWSFFKRAERQKDGAATKTGREPRPRRQLSFTQIVEGMGDFRDLEHRDVALKFWLPEAVDQALDELRKVTGDSTSEVLRQFFVVHCYGLYAFHQMKDAAPGLFKDATAPLFSRKASIEKEGPARKRTETYWVPELGKNVAPIKVWIPARLRDDLQTLADHVGIKLSQYLREIVISRVLGHGMLPSRPEMLLASPSIAADAWCEGKEVPFVQVSEEEFRRSDAVEIRAS